LLSGFRSGTSIEYGNRPAANFNPNPRFMRSQETCLQGAYGLYNEVSVVRFHLRIVNPVHGQHSGNAFQPDGSRSDLEKTSAKTGRSGCKNVEVSWPEIRDAARNKVTIT
jgi:hypothetical protein